MLSVLKTSSFRHLFMAQVVALLGTGLLTVALGLLAYELAGDSAGLVLGTAYTIKMVAYVGLAPIAAVVTSRMNRKSVLICADLCRAGVALCLPFIDAVWQIYILIFVLQAASATFTPTFQAVIPDILKDEKDYTSALSLSRLAYDIENLVSPALAGLLLTVISFHWLFFGTVFGFVVSALLVLVTVIPPLLKKAEEGTFWNRVTRGSKIYLATPRLRGLLSLNLAIAATGSMVLVNTIVFVRSSFEGSEQDVAIVFACYGAGSMIAAFALPSVLERMRDWPVMMVGGLGSTVVTLTFALIFLTKGLPSWPVFLATWAVLGLLGSLVMTPSGRLLRRSAHSEDRPALFAAQFALSHACWLIAYPTAGYFGKWFGLGATMVVLAGLALLGCWAVYWFWPSKPQQVLEHSHDDLPPDHPHLADAVVKNGRSVHRHYFVIDDEHRVWPTQG